MNLSTARSEKRSKEVGIRKTLGSLRAQLIVQFFSESLLTVILAFVISLGIVKFTLPFFNEIADKKMQIPWTNSYFWLEAVGFILITGLVAGSYPSFYLSSFRPIKVLKGNFKSGRFAAIPRKILVVTQFAVSVLLMIGTIIVYRQIEFAKNRPVGYERDGLISLTMMTPAIRDHFEAFRSELMQTGAISSITESGSPATSIWNSTSGFSWPGKDPNLSTDFGVVSTSYDYGKTLRWKLREGRDFSRDFPTDTSAIILNEAAERFMALKGPVGKTVTWWGKPLQVIGVIENIIAQSPYDEVKPIMYALSNNDFNVLIMSIKPDVGIKYALGKIESVVKKYNPDQPFEYKFVDEEYAGKFKAEQRIGELSAIFASLAIFISCLGLFGLASFVAEQRSREIGLRKVLGASIFNLWSLLLRDFILLVVIACLISGPVAHIVLGNWLSHYTYHTQISWWIFLVSGLGALLITLFTVSFQALKAAFTNPVKTLRSE
jgi:ABC-type antimicrobial peptide transport system permease subunit